MKDLPAMVSVVIVTWNKKQDVVRCLNSVKKSIYPSLEIIVVDNNSTDGTSGIIEQDFPEVTLIKNPIDLLAAGGRNTGIKYAKGDFIFFLDDDNVVDDNAISMLVEIMSGDKEIGIAGPKMYYLKDPQRIWYAGSDISLITGKTGYVGLNEIDAFQYESIRETGHVPNAFLVRREAIEAIKGFDESYVMFYEESDFAFRVKKCNFKVVFCPQARVWHNVLPPVCGRFFTLGLGSPERAYYASRNRAVYMKRHANIVCFLFFLISFFPATIIFYIWHTLGLNRYDLLKTYLIGSWDGLIFGITGKLRDRQKSRQGHVKR
ncbi:MAG TPA: glycosyltransferase family 2 protein [Candidatus Omnitrophica bacterium]|nr:glycosyltransferase family 2 protein [Candidatus Omnitrophota bacterium]